MTASKIPTAVTDEILTMLTELKLGHFTKRLGATDEPALNLIIQGINELAQALDTQQPVQKEKDQLEAETQFAITALGLGIWSLDPRTNCLKWDRGMHRLYDIEPKDFSGAKDAWENALTPDALVKAQREVQLALSGEKPFNTTFQIQLKNGGLRHLAARAVVLRNENGEPIKMYGVNWDVTQKVHSDLQLREHEILLSTVLQNLPVAVFGKDIQNDYKWNIWNKHAEELFGFKADDCIGKSDKDFFPKDQIESYRAADIAASQIVGVIEVPEETAQTPNGTILLHTRKIVIRDSKGEPKILLGISENITERKAKEKLRAEQEAQLMLIADNIPGPIARVDRDGRYVFVNKIYEDWYGLAREKIIGKKPSDIFTPEFSSKIEPYIKRAMAGERLSFEAQQVTFDERKFFIHITLIPYLNTDGFPDGFFAVVHNITALKEAEAKLVQSSKLASLGEMSAGIAHEINNPLSIISGSVGLLNKFINDPERFAQKIETIQKAIDRIAKIVGGLKKFSRSSERKIYNNCLLSEIVKETLVLTDAKFKRHNTYISCDLNSNSLIYCDQVEIEQLLINLLNNSIDAVKDRDVKWVKIETSETPQSVVLRMIDSGSGIPENVRSKLFDPFFTTKVVGEGTGLGLSITKGILDEHKATITVIPDVPNTCFEIHFAKNAIPEAA